MKDYFTEFEVVVLHVLHYCLLSDAPDDLKGQAVSWATFLIHTKMPVIYGVESVDDLPDFVVAVSAAIVEDSATIAFDLHTDDAELTEKFAKLVDAFDQVWKAATEDPDDGVLRLMPEWMKN
jgi:hypothetical protein